MAKLTTKTRNRLADSDFALSGRRYPIFDKGHAKAALARAAEFLDPKERAIVEAKVHRRFPGMTLDKEK